MQYEGFFVWEKCVKIIQYMDKIIIANWKMNPETAEEAIELFELVKRGVAEVNGIDVVICPPFVYLPILKGLKLGAQNVFYKEEGAFTGEVSPLMLKDLGVEYVIVGHSESRKYLNETDEIVNNKVIEALKVGLKPILCVGEKDGEDREEGLRGQLSKGLKDISEEEIKNVIIAYEPVWAIGTGNNCSPKDAEKVAGFIKKMISESVKVIYGGSVNSDNSNSYLSESNIEGLLVGGDALNAEDFIKIVKSAEN